MSSFSLAMQPVINFASGDPMLRLAQAGLVLGGSLVVFLLFYATRDIILRTRSFLYQFASILLVAALPVVGFLLYLLVRPARTVKEREMEKMLKKLTEHAKEKKPAIVMPPKHEKHDKKQFIAKHHHTTKVAQKSQQPLEPVPV